jgi:hypothetical protein
MNIWDALRRHEVRFSFNVAGCYVCIAGKSRLIRHSQARRLFESMIRHPDRHIPTDMSTN